MIPIRAILLILALACFLVAAIIETPSWNRLVAAGLAAFTAAALL